MEFTRAIRERPTFMKIFVTGTRGIPNIPGGVESHCENLYPIIASMGHEVLLARRTTYITDHLSDWEGVQLIDIFAPKKRSLEAIVHTFLAVLSAKKHRADILHIHAIGPSLLVPFARLLGLRVVMTNHGPDYDRQKWSGRPAKAMLRLGEYLGGRYANEVIVISRVIEGIVQKRCHRSSNLIFNGVVPPPENIQTDYIESMGIQANNYLFAAARFVPEKGLHDLITAFKNNDINCQLVIAGDADHEDDYSRGLKQSAEEDARIILTGYVTGQRLQQLFNNASLFVLPSYHEGLPIALLEALSYQLPGLVSDIPANKEVGLNKKYYFRCGDTVALGKKIKELIESPMDADEKLEIENMLKLRYDWGKIAEQTVAVYESAVAKKNKPN